MSAEFFLVVSTVVLLDASLIGLGFLWGVQYAAEGFRLRLKRRWLRLGLFVLTPVACVLGAVFWKLESVRVRVQTAISNEGANE